MRSAARPVPPRRALGARADNTAPLGELRMPTLALWGKDDALVAPDIGRQLASKLPRASFHQLDHCGHLPTLEQPAAAAALSGTLLRECA